MFYNRRTSRDTQQASPQSTVITVPIRAMLLTFHAVMFKWVRFFLQKRPLKKTLLMLCCCQAVTCQAADLIDIYLQSLENDSTFKAAYSTFMSNSEALPQARAALLPQLNVSTQTQRMVERVSAGGLLSNVTNSSSAGPNTGEFTIQQTYNSNVLTVQASQAIFNYQSWAQVQKAKASVKAAHATFNDAAQNLILRTAKAYFAVLLARDTLNFAESKKRANQRQLEQAKQRFEVGLDAIISVYEAKAGYDQSLATVISARNNQVNQIENLRKLTNHVYDFLSPLRNSKIPLIRPEPNNVDDWIATGLKQNYNLFAAKYGLQAARENIKATAASGWPTLAIQGNSSQTHNSNLTSNVFVPSEEIISSVALALTFPVYKGGLIESQTRQAQYNFQTQSEQLESVYRDVVVNSQIAFNTISDGISKVKADRQTVSSRVNALDSTEAQFQVGTRTMVDVVNAQQRLFEAQQQLASDQYDLINAILQLKYYAGSLNVADLQEINSWLNTTRINGFPKTQRHT